MKKKLLVCDAASIKNNETYFIKHSIRWPVKEALFSRLTNFLFSEYIKKIKNLKGTAYKIAVIEIGFLGTLLNILHYNYIKNFAREKNYTLLHSKTSDTFLNPDWERIGNFYRNINHPYNKSNRMIRRLVKMIYFNIHLGLLVIISYIFKRKRNISLGSFDTNKKDYIKKTKEFYYHLDYVDFISNKNYSTSFENINIKYNIINIVLNKLNKENSLRVFLKGLDIEKIVKVSQMRLKVAHNLYESLMKVKAPKEILLTESANPFHKIISSVFIEKGTKVINFSHGNNIGLVNQKWTDTYIYSQSGNYFVETINICKIFKANSLKLPLAKKEKINFFSINNKIGLNKKNINSFKISKKEVKKVMLIGFPMNSIRYTDEAYCFFHYKLKLEIHILRQLKKAGYYTIYKTHPDRLKELGNIMSNEANECNGDKFEKIWHSADALLFTYVTTTTFGYALTTPLPITVIGIKGTAWHKSRKSFVNKRVDYLGAFDDIDYLKINGIRLKKSFQKASKKLSEKKIEDFFKYI